MMLNATAGALLGITHEHSNKALIKVGRSNSPKDRLNQVNVGFPEQSAVKWTLKAFQKFPSAQIAHQFEDELKSYFSSKFSSQGGEFYTGDAKALEAEFNSFCYSRLPKISGAPGKAKGI